MALCPCCKIDTILEKGGFEICPVCSWQDDGQDDDSADEIFGGPNQDYSLKEARNNFKERNIMYRKGDSKFPKNKKLHKLQKEIINLSKKLTKKNSDEIFEKIYSIECLKWEIIDKIENKQKN